MTLHTLWFRVIDNVTDTTPCFLVLADFLSVILLTDNRSEYVSQNNNFLKTYLCIIVKC
jgi:hypothetical protein